MLVVIPFHKGDKEQAISLATWIRDLGQVSEHNCLLCVGENCEEAGVIEPLRDAFRSVTAYRQKTPLKRGEGLMGYARAANAMWQSVAWKIFFQESGQGKRQVPWLWLEPDAIPTRPTWLREVDDEYRAARKPFMGQMGQAQIAMLNGVAVYPSNVADYAPLALQAGDCPWDMNAAPQILKYANVSDLFQHIYQIKGEAPTFPKHAEKLSQKAAIFHRSKDGTLIEYLKKHGFTSEVHTVHAAPVLEPKPVLRAPVEIADSATEEEGLGEPVDYTSKMSEFERNQPPIARRPNEGERNGDLVWRRGAWHTEPLLVNKPPIDRKAVIDHFKHAALAVENVGGVEPKSARPDASESGAKGEVSTLTPSREDLVKEAVAVLKKLCTAPRYTAEVRKELKRQKVTR